VYAQLLLYRAGYAGGNQ